MFIKSFSFAKVNSALHDEAVSVGSPDLYFYAAETKSFFTGLKQYLLSI